MNQREIPALGRPFRVGQLYDARRDKIVAETPWGHISLNDKKLCALLPNYEYKLIAEDTATSKARELKLDANLKLSFCAGLIEVDGSAKFLQDSKSSENISRVSLRYHSTQRYEEISTPVFNEVEFGDVLKQTQATHVVSRVIYGYDAFFVFERRVSENEKMTDVSGDMHAVIKKIPTLNIEGEISGQLTDREKEEITKIDCIFYGDFSPESMPTTFEQALKVYHDIPKRLGIAGPDPIDPKSEIGKPQWVSLYPISSIKIHQQEVPRVLSIVTIDGSATDQVPLIIEHLSDMSVWANDLVNNPVCSRFESLIKEVKMFREALNSFRQKVKKDLQTTIPAIRSGEKKNSDLDRYLQNIDKSPFGRDELNSYKKRKNKELSYLTQTLKNLKLGSAENIVEIFTTSKNAATDLPALLFNPQYKFIFCFVINVKASKPLKYIEGMKKFASDFTVEDIDLKEKFASPGDDKEWFDDHDVIAKFRKIPSLFASQAAACAGQKDTIFAVTDTHQDVTLGDPVTLLYKDGDIICKNFNISLEKIHEPEYNVERVISTGGASTIHTRIQWIPLMKVQHYFVWYDEDIEKIENRTANKKELRFSDSDMKDIQLSSYLSIDMYSNFRGYMCVSAVWEYDVLTDSPIIHTTE